MLNGMDPTVLAELVRILPFLIPIALLQLGLQIYCVVKIAKTEGMDQTKRLIWLLVVIFGSLLGAIAYLLFGRTKEE